MKNELLLKAFWIVILASGGGESTADETGKAVDFIKDIQPLFQRACIHCHGSEKQKSDYRLDVRETAFKGGESSAPNILPGKSSESPLMQLITGKGDLVMPPDGQRLSDSEIDLIRKWIDQGANWPDSVAGHVQDKADLWSLKPLVRPSVPASQDVQIAPIDAFVRTRLKEVNLSPTPEADRRDLIRRVTFDLIGLPPSPEEIDQFVSDTDSHAYEKLVDRLLESPRYGERWARHWLDTAHFAETHGHDQDRIREHAWPYRDYLIQSLNSDKPYSQFVQEQVAGDVLFPDDPSATAALGFLAAGPWDESSLRDIREDTIDRQVARYLDRDDIVATVMNNFCSLTVQCARCHDHKFDPVTQHDYYSLQAVFSGVERANRRYDADPEIQRLRTALTARKKAIELRSEAAGLMSDDVRRKVLDWEKHLRQQTDSWHLVNAVSMKSSDGAILTRLPDGSILSGGACPEKDTVTIVCAPFEASSQIAAIRLEVLTDASLPRSGPGRHPDNGNFHLSEFEVFIEGKEQPLELIRATADFSQSDWEIGKSIDHNDSTAWGIHPKEGVPHRAVFELKEPLSQMSIGPGEQPPRLRIVLKQLHGRSHLIGRMRICVSESANANGFDVIPGAIASILAVPIESRSDDQRLELAAYQQLEHVNREIALLPPSSLVYSAAADFEPDGSLRPPPGPRPIHILHRGDIRQPRDEVSPGSVACVSQIPSRFEISPAAPESARRVALARWLTHKENPLPWRSIVNRIWYLHFGRGIVGTVNDFGHMGEKPSHPELLDWLALEFRDGGQSIKQLHRLILTSQTYRQKVESPSKHADVITKDGESIDQRLTFDADNRLLWRMNRTRLDAESIRDAVLAISGRMDLRMGGPSDRQFDLQPGIHVTPRVDYGKFDLRSDLGRRRSIYRFLFRTLPDPFMESLDCPSGDQMVPVRGNSVTIQQVLALWNDAFIAQHCEFIADRIEKELAGQTRFGDKSVWTIERAYRLILGRVPSEKEMKEVAQFTADHGLANLCRLLLNSNEFIFLN